MGVINNLNKSLTLDEVKKIYPIYNDKIGNGFKDETNNKYGKLTVLYRTNNVGKIACWVCKCDCGNYTKVRGNHLRSGKVSSCGCAQKEKMYNLLGIDLTGERFGKLIALYPLKERKNGNIVWHCKCDCGKECDVKGEYLRNGDTKSCGCLGSSYGEYEIEQFLLKNNYQYQKEYSFNDLKDILPLRFDFAIFNNNNNNISFLIEYDGLQHYNTKDRFYSKELIRHDEMKNKYCIKNNIKLLRIKYKEDVEEKIKNFERSNNIYEN